MGRDLNKTIIIDNTPTSYALQPENAIPVTSWFDDKNDVELIRLIPILEKMSKMTNVKEYLR